MKKKITFFILILVVVCLMIFAPVIVEVFDSTSHNGNDVTVIIPKGTAVNTIANILKQNNLIKNELSFKIKVKLSGYNQLNWGTYDLNDGMCLEDILKELSSGNGVKQITLTVPEGFSVQNIAQRIEKSGICSGEDFLKALSDEYEYDFIKYIPNGDYDYKLQGFLFPETYNFMPDTSAHEVVDIMLSTFDQKYRENIGEYNDSLFEIIIKASLVEKEAQLEKERPLIAGVIENRLDINMPLQVDAAIVYAVTEGKYDITKVSYANLEVDSPYNIYKNTGLPAGPICNPGISSVKAAVKPDNHKYLYYHTDNEKNDGSHIFSETYTQHLGSMN